MFGDLKQNSPIWTLFLDGSSTNVRSGPRTSDQNQLNSSAQFGLKALNNEFEYKALIVALEMIKAVEAARV